MFLGPHQSYPLSDGMTYLHQAVSESDTENVKFLLRLGVDVNARVKVRR